MFKIKSLLALALSLFTFVAFAGDTLQISQQELLNALENNTEHVVILDVRSEDEFIQGHIAGAINVSYDNVASKLGQLTQYQKSKLVVYCRSGRRAGIAEQVLAENGFTNLRHLTGDMNGWQAANLPVIVGKTVADKKAQ
ncbi:MAG: rhodanese-like domain-containing protein [Colwellia sp.]|nr:rhodanese-like domain-containing protein [Colwellia sp.]